MSSRSVQYSTNPLLASKTPIWRSQFIVACIALGFMGGVRVLDDVAKTQYIVASCELPLQLAWVNGRLFVQHHHKKVCVYK